MMCGTTFLEVEITVIVYQGIERSQPCFPNIHFHFTLSRAGARTEPASSPDLA